MLCRVRPVLPHELAKAEEGVDICSFPLEGHIVVQKDKATSNRCVNGGEGG